MSRTEVCEPRICGLRDARTVEGLLQAHLLLHLALHVKEGKGASSDGRKLERDESETDTVSLTFTRGAFV
jgi:hypothetical protein